MRTKLMTLATSVFLLLATIGAAPNPIERDVLCEVDSSTTIMRLVPDGTKVTKGEVVCELDPTTLKAQLANQKVSLEAAKAAHQNAKLTHEVAEIAIKEHEATLTMRVEQADGEVQIADGELALARSFLAKSKEAPKTDATTIERTELDLDRAKLASSQARMRKAILHDFTLGREKGELRVESEKARSDEVAKKAAVALEVDKVQKLETMIARCRLVAPADGVVAYWKGKVNRPIEVGATVQDRQPILRVEGAK